MKIEQTGIPGLLVILPTIHGDQRGWFMESYSKAKFEDLGIKTVFVQDNHSFSSEKNTLRGMHFQTGEKAQAKLIRCIKGKIWDVAIDLRKGSPTYLKWFGIELSSHNSKQLYIPKGFAHGFLTLTKNVEVEYKVDEFYSKEHDGGIRYNDSKFSINWDRYLKNQLPILSTKDNDLTPFDEKKNGFIF